MASTYSNLPLEKTTKNSMVQAYDAQYSKPFEINVSALSAMTGFFESKQFDITAAESISIVILKQATIDGYNPMKILDTLKGLNDLELSALVSEILNFNRIKTSFLGQIRQNSSNSEVKRNILA
jgi:hypothetical protein